MSQRGMKEKNMRVYEKDSFDVVVKKRKYNDHVEQDIKDVATALRKELKEYNIKLSIDTGALLYAFFKKCGVEECQ
jgi:hypothetical protein